MGGGATASDSILDCPPQPPVCAITSMILVSLALTLVLNLLRRFF
ncbi:MAG: hypothetical protein WAM82_12315 [Thermoanaerobaculia bacterium]